MLKGLLESEQQVKLRLIQKVKQMQKEMKEQKGPMVDQSTQTRPWLSSNERLNASMAMKSKNHASILDESGKESESSYWRSRRNFDGKRDFVKTAQHQPNHFSQFLHHEQAKMQPTVQRSLELPPHSGYARSFIKALRSQRCHYNQVSELINSEISEEAQSHNSRKEEATGLVQKQIMQRSFTQKYKHINPSHPN